MGNLSDYTKNVILTNELIFNIVEFDFSATVFADQYLVSLLDLESNDITVIIFLSSTKSYDFGFLWLFLSGIGNVDPTLYLLVLIDLLHKDAISQWSYFYFTHFPFFWVWFDM